MFNCFLQHTTCLRYNFSHLYYTWPWWEWVCKAWHCQVRTAKVCPENAPFSSNPSVLLYLFSLSEQRCEFKASLQYQQSNNKMPWSSNVTGSPSTAYSMQEFGSLIKLIYCMCLVPSKRAAKIQLHLWKLTEADFIFDLFIFVEWFLQWVLDWKSWECAVIHLTFSS